MAILTLPEVLQRTKVSRSTLYAMLDRGEFPRPFKLGERKNGWTAAQLDAWEAEREAESRTAAGGN